MYVISLCAFLWSIVRAGLAVGRLDFGRVVGGVREARSDGRGARSWMRFEVIVWRDRLGSRYGGFRSPILGEIMNFWCSAGIENRSVICWVRSVSVASGFENIKVCVFPWWEIVIESSSARDSLGAVSAMMRLTGG